MVGSFAKNERRRIGQDCSQKDTTGHKKRGSKEKEMKERGTTFQTTELRARDRTKWHSRVDASCANGR